MATARANQISIADTAYYHCTARCVRRAFLCGKDDFSGKNYEHRREWTVERMNELTQAFAIEVCSYAIMSNHYHMVLHIDKNKAEGWDDHQVLKQWCKMFSGSLLTQRYLSGEQLDEVEQNLLKEDVVEYRSRLMSISWFMRCLNEYLAKRANKEDECKGRFWEGRFTSQPLLDESALLTCMTYVDLNPIRAKLADKPETSHYTSIKERIKKLKETTNKEQPFTLKPFRTSIENSAKSIPFTLKSYIELVDWAGRMIRKDKKGAISKEVPEILTRLNINSDAWVKSLNKSNFFKRVIGNVASLMKFAQKEDKEWVHGIKESALIFNLG